MISVEEWDELKEKEMDGKIEEVKDFMFTARQGVF